MLFAGREVREKLCQSSRVRPEAAGRGPYPRPRAQFFPMWTDLGRRITCFLFSSVEYFVSSFCVVFQTWCKRAFDIWEIGNLINITHIDGNSEIVCFLGHYLHFTFFAVKKKKCLKRRESWKISSGPYAGSGWENLDRWSAHN